MCFKGSKNQQYTQRNKWNWLVQSWRILTLWTRRRAAIQRPKKVSCQVVPFIAWRVLIKPAQFETLKLSFLYTYRHWIWKNRSHIISIKIHVKDYEQTLNLPVIISMPHVALTWYPSMASSNKRSRGSQRAERLAPWHRPAEEERDPKAITAWNFCSELVLHSRDNTIRASEVNCWRDSGVRVLEFLKAEEFAWSNCNRWMKSSQCEGLTM